MIEEGEFSDVTSVNALERRVMARTSVCLPPVKIKPADKNSTYPSHTDVKLEYFKGLSRDLSFIWLQGGRVMVHF